MGGQVLETYADIIEKTGRAEGRAEGREEGRTEGRIEGQVLAYKDVGLSDAEIAQKTNISVEEVARILKEA